MLADIARNGETRSTERRRAPRAELVSDLYGCLTGMNVSIVVRDASAGGFSVESPVPFLPGSEHAFLFDTEASPATVIAICRHSMRVNLTDGTAIYIAGFEYAPQAPDQVRRVRDLIGDLV